MITFEWKIYTHPKDAWKSMYEDCEKSESSIDMEQYIFNDDEVGNKFANLFLEKAKLGVRIRLLCDAVGSSTFLASDKVSALSHAGVQILFFNPISPWRIHNYSSWFFRDHNKVLIVDRKVGHIGSAGIHNRMQDWRDTNVRFEGGMIKSLEEAFNRMWNVAMTKRRIRFHKLNSDTVGFSLLTNSPRFRQTFIYDALIAAIRGAKDHIYLTTPYFVPDLRFFRALRLAAKRGVDVKLLLPGKSDIRFLDLAANSYFHLAMKSGIKIYLYKHDRVLHAKTAVIDNFWSTVGSCNLDNLSFKYNYESNLVSTDAKFSLELKKQFLQDLIDATMLDKEVWSKRSRFAKSLELITWPVHNIL